MLECKVLSDDGFCANWTEDFDRGDDQVEEKKAD
jgi:hypothetical protein